MLAPERSVHVLAEYPNGCWSAGGEGAVDVVGVGAAPEPCLVARLILGIQVESQGIHGVDGVVRVVYPSSGPGASSATITLPLDPSPPAMPPLLKIS